MTHILKLLVFPPQNDTFDLSLNIKQHHNLANCIQKLCRCAVEIKIIGELGVAHLLTQLSIIIFIHGPARSRFRG